MNDKEILTWLHRRLVAVHGEDESTDYMHRLRAIIATTPPVAHSHALPASEPVTPAKLSDEQIAGTIGFSVMSPTAIAYLAIGRAIEAARDAQWQAAMDEAVKAERALPPGWVDVVMAQAKVFASSWSLISIGRRHAGQDQLALALAEENKLREMLEQVALAAAKESDK